MERQPTGAGPETTGINEQDEQLALFDDALRNEGIELPPSDIAAGALHRQHALRYRPDRPQRREHPGVRGDRLEVTCWHEGEVVRWRPSSSERSEGVPDGRS